MTLKPKTYPILVQAVEVGVAYGYHRAYKHADEPTEAQIKDAVIEGVLNEICDWFEIADVIDGQDMQEQEEEECFCDRNGIGVRGVSCGDCPTRDYGTRRPR
jgi:hypothetical protein